MLADRIGGIFLGLLGLTVVIAASRLPSIPGQPIGPAVFPTIIGCTLGLLGLVLIFVQQQMPEASDEPHSFPNLLRVLSPVVILVLGYFAIEPLGFLLTGIAIIFFCGLALRGSAINAFALAVAMTLLIYTIFATLLRVPLPAGILSLPW